ncbi:MAG: DUF6054 family protein [Beduini sp.]|uniref:DUF6054 family protein n=1 Tax=Beduini sp. TaxID=1922300 RepID=UPI0039A3C15E
MEKESYINLNGVDCAVLIYERHKYIVSYHIRLNITILADQADVYIISISTCRSQGITFSLDRFGEGAFLENYKKL